MAVVPVMMMMMMMQNQKVIENKIFFAGRRKNVKL
jgi:hypothetical protein